MTSKKTYLIIGASRGIGEALVKRIASDPLNQVIACSRNVNRMNARFTGLTNVHSFSLDLEKDSVGADLSQLLKPFGKVDYMINNAGYLVNKPFTELTHRDIVTSYQINVIGVIQCVQSVLEHMDSGHIVNISSMGGFQGSMKFPGLTAYSTSKAALCSFTELFAEEHKDTDVKMNCLCLGAVQTEMLNEAFPGYEAPIGPDKMAEFIADFTSKQHQWMNGKIIPVSLSTP